MLRNVNSEVFFLSCFPKKLILFLINLIMWSPIACLLIPTSRYCLKSPNSEHKKQISLCRQFSCTVSFWKKKKKERTVLKYENLSKYYWTALYSASCSLNIGKINKQEMSVCVYSTQITKAGSYGEHVSCQLGIRKTFFSTEKKKKQKNIFWQLIHKPTFLHRIKWLFSTTVNYPKNYMTISTIP